MGSFLAYRSALALVIALVIVAGAGAIISSYQADRVIVHNQTNNSELISHIDGTASNPIINFAKPIPKDVNALNILYPNGELGYQERLETGVMQQSIQVPRRGIFDPVETGTWTVVVISDTDGIVATANFTVAKKGTQQVQTPVKNTGQ